jgi:hypothetical protein
MGLPGSAPSATDGSSSGDGPASSLSAPTPMGEDENGDGTVVATSASADCSGTSTNEALTCSICWETLGVYGGAHALIACAHSFCRECIATHLETKRKLGAEQNCPECRRPVSPAEQEACGSARELEESDDQEDEEGEEGEEGEAASQHSAGEAPSWNGSDDSDSDSEDSEENEDSEDSEDREFIVRKKRRVA